MAKIGDIQYRMECPVCGRRCLVDTPTSKLPKHPPKGETVEPYVPYVPCPGSGLVGIVIDTKVKGFD
jgi:hypothetical protein